MGRSEADRTVRYVSPVTARLYTKTSPKILGLSVSERLAMIASNQHQSRDWQHENLDGHRDDDAEQSGDAASEFGEMTTDPWSVEVARPCARISTSGTTCPQAYLESILKERGYDAAPRSSKLAGCHCSPTQKQLDDYQMPLVEAVRKWDLEALEAMAARGINMGASNRFGESIVHLATRRGSASILNFILANGGSLAICDDYGKTPLHDAFWAGDPRFDLVAMMLDIDWTLLRAADVRGATPLQYAKRRHWGLWCNFLDRVKDVYWPMRNGQVEGEPPPRNATAPSY